MQSSGIIYYHDWDKNVSREKPKAPKKQQSSGLWIAGLGMLALSLGGLTAPLVPRLRLETHYAVHSARQAAAPTSLQGESLKVLKVQPADPEFSLIVPKIGINARVIPDVNPTKSREYNAALEAGIAHSSLSYFPNEDGTVYLFSHSTNYDWFVKDLNAVFYLLKNLEEDDLVVVYYKNTPYTYKITGKQVVKPTAIEYLVPQKGAKKLILQTCWPPGSIAERLLIFADLIEDPTQEI